MDYKEIKKIIDDMGDSKLDSLEIEFPEGVKISMTKNSQKKVTINTPQTIETSSQTSSAVKIEQENSLDEFSDKKQNDYKEENYKTVKSPMVGTFYESSTPDKEPFVKIGDKVHKGQVLCIIEAMKLMNEIESEFDGEIVEICAKNQELVEYGMPLFKIK